MEMSLIVKLASLAVHVQEMDVRSPTFEFDNVAAKGIANHPEVVEWLATLDPALLPVKRDGVTPMANDVSTQKQDRPRTPTDVIRSVLSLGVDSSKAEDAAIEIIKALNLEGFMLVRKAVLTQVALDAESVLNRLSTEGWRP